MFLNNNYSVDINNDFEYFKNFYQELFKKDITYKNWQEISIDELNLIRDDLYNYELNLHRDKLNFLLMNKTDKKLWKYLKMF